MTLGVMAIYFIVAILNYDNHKNQNKSWFGLSQSVPLFSNAEFKIIYVVL
jgi:hypothetical protein